MTKTLLIFNPIANKGEANQRIDEVKTEAAKYGEFDFAHTKEHRHAITLAETAALDGYEKVIAIGGDGTVHQVVNGIMRVSSEKRPILGIVPFGSGNDFSFNANLKLDLPEALKAAFTGTPTPIDIGLIKDDKGGMQYFANACGMFIEAAINLQSQRKSILKGFVMYLGAVIRAIIENFDPAPVDLTIDGKTTKNTIIMFSVCNGPREGGGFMIAPNAVNNDGELDYMMVTPLPRLKMLSLLPKIMSGAHVTEESVTIGRFKSLTIDSTQTIPFHLDGELVADFELGVKSVTIEIIPDAVQICK